MIPGPIEVSPAVIEAFATRPPSHVAADVIEAFGAALEDMRRVWLASTDSQPFALAGSGTIAMEMAATNVVSAGDAALVINTGYFADRMAEMLTRRGAKVTQLRAEIGASPTIDAIGEALATGGYRAVFTTHVDTSTAVRTDAAAIAKLANEHGALSIFDGVCATAGERFEMADWGADIYLTASQKAIGLPVGMALMVVSPRALQARERLTTPPPLSIDFAEWLPIMRAYEERRGSYFSTPPTNHVLALHVSLAEHLAAEHGELTGMAARFALHQRAANAMRAAWTTMDLEPLCVPQLAANTLSALRYPKGVTPQLVKRIASHGVIVAGGLHPKCRGEYFRVGHMGAVTSDTDALLRTVEAVARGLQEEGHDVDTTAARQAAASVLLDDEV